MPRRSIFRSDNELCHADFCEPLKQAAERGDARIVAPGRGSHIRKVACRKMISRKSVSRAIGIPPTNKRGVLAGSATKDWSWLSSKPDGFLSILMVNFITWNLGGSRSPARGRRTGLGILNSSRACPARRVLSACFPKSSRDASTIRGRLSPWPNSAAWGEPHSFRAANKMSITEAAFSCGFQSSRYFSTVFLAYQACSPQE